MNNLHTKMDNHGRLLIPKHIRNQLNYKKGDNFVIRIINDELHIVSLKNAIAHAQALIKPSLSNSISMTDEFISQRRKEALEEDVKFSKPFKQE